MPKPFGLSLPEKDTVPGGHRFSLPLPPITHRSDRYSLRSNHHNRAPKPQTIWLYWKL